MKNKRPARQLTTYQQARLQVVGYRAIQAEVHSLLDSFGLNTSQWVILGWLYDHPAGLRITALAEILDVETPLITALLQPLVKNRFVTQKTDPSDKRARLASLTEKGVGLVTKLEPQLTTYLERFNKNISQAELDNYFQVLEYYMRASNR
jgi:DNA-binding MarR family transcriptional regulator